MRLLLFGWIAVISLSACQTNPTQPEQSSAPGDMINLQTLSNAEATDKLIKRLGQAGYLIRQTRADEFVLNYDNHDFIISVRLIEGGLSRLVVSRLFGIHPQYKNSPELFALMLSANRNVNFAKFSMLPQNEAGQIQASITFINEQVSLEEIEQFLKWMDHSIDQVKEMVPVDLQKMLYRLPGLSETSQAE